MQIHYHRKQVSGSAGADVTTTILSGRAGFRLRIVKHHGRGGGGTATMLILNATDGENSSYNAPEPIPIAGGSIDHELFVEKGHPFGIGRDVTVTTGAAGGTATGHTVDYYYERAKLRRS